jgi:putative ABC transport system permease protein
MISSYLKSARRFFRKNIGLIALNVTVFGIGLAACVLILQKVSYEYSYDKFNSGYENIYRVSLDHYYPFDTYQSSTAGAFYPIGDQLKEEYAEIKEFARVSSKRTNYTVTVGDNSFRENNVYLVSPSFFKIFTVDITKGDTIEMGAKDVFLSQSRATKLFEETNPVGASLDLGGNLLKVKGVYKDVPNNSHFKYDILIVVMENKAQMSNWQNYNVYNYIKLNEGVDRKEFEEKLKPFNKEYSKLSDEQSSVDYRWEIKLQPLSSIHLESDLDFEHEINGDLEGVYLLMVMAFLILTISCFNYVNLTNSMYAKRLSEFFVRKLHGATSGNLLKQYALESFILLFIGFVIGGVVLFLLPYVSDYSVSIRSQTGWFYGGLLGIIAVCFLLSVVVPSFAFAVVNPLLFANGQNASNPLLKGLGKPLIVVQFVVSFILIAGALTIDRQLGFITTKNPGINISDVITVDFPGLRYSEHEGALNKMSVDLKKHPTIQSVSFSEDVPGTKFSSDGSIRFVENSSDQAILNYYQTVSSEYFNTYEMTILEGRVFDERRPADSLAILVNESMAKKLNVVKYHDLIGRKVTMPWGRDYSVFEIVGVVKDYYHESLKNAIVPCVFIPIKLGGSCNKVSVRLNNADAATRKEAIALIKKTQEDLFSHAFRSAFVEDNYSGQYNSYAEISRLIKALAFLAILMAGVGLFGLASNETEKRTKEVAIRKINGAAVSDIYVLFLKYFLRLIALSFVISLPVSFYFAIDWLNNFAVKIDIGAWFIGIQILITGVVGLVSISYYLIKATLKNPIVVLRNKG